MIDLLAKMYGKQLTEVKVAILSYNSTVLLSFLCMTLYDDTHIITHCDIYRVHGKTPPKYNGVVIKMLGKHQ